MTTPSSPSSPSSPSFTDFADAHRAELVAFRRHLHAYPELSYEEHETTDLVAQRLAAAGLEPHVLPDGCGLVCDVGDGPGPVVALRADLDALAMEDEKDVAYRSHRDGVAHACGHDVHTTVVLGAGLALAERAAAGALPGRVRLVFEPGEEALPSGALRMIEAGVLDGVSAIWGVHCDPKLDVGRMAVRVGALTSAADLMAIDLHGPGGHTARPERTVDLVHVAARLVTELPALVQERAAAFGDLRVVFGSLQSGHAANVIPARAQLRGTVRTPTREVWQRAEVLVAEAVGDILAGSGAEFHIDHQRGIPPVVNEPRATDRLRAAARSVLGDDLVEEAPQSLGGDSFAWYCEHVPGSYGRLGTHDPAKPEPRLDLHSSTFDVHEDAIGIGVSVLAQVALDALTDLTATGDRTTEDPDA